MRKKKQKRGRKWYEKPDKFNQLSPQYQQFYQSKEWRQLRAYKLATNPICEVCESKGLLEEATQVHHLVSITDDWSKRFEYNLLQSICLRCHTIETNRAIAERKRMKSGKVYTQDQQDIINNELKNYKNNENRQT